MNNSFFIDYQESMIRCKKEIEEIFGGNKDKPVTISAELETIDNIYRKITNDLRPKIMVYGIYNAGKSSVINALLRKQVARVRDVPTTDSVDVYDWNGYEIADTPGVNAPIEHERITLERLKQTDVVLFVISNMGSHDKAYNYECMRDIDAAGKQIIVILNDKQGDLLNEEGSPERNGLREIAAKVRANIKDLGIKQDCKIVFVNAEVAQQAEEEEDAENARILREISNMDELERVIFSELKKSNDFVVLRNAVTELEKALENIIDKLSKEDDSQGMQQLNEILNLLREQKIGLRKNMQAYIERRAGRLATTLPDMIWDNREEQDKIGQVIQTEAQKICEDAQKQLDYSLGEIQDTIDIEMNRLADEVNELKLENEYGVTVRDTTVEAPLTSNRPRKISKEDVDGLLVAAKEIIDIYNKNKLPMDGHVVRSAKGTKLIEGVIAGQAVKSVVEESAKALAKTSIGKVVAAPIPYIGPIITVISVLSSILGGDNSDMERAQQEAAAQNEYERRKVEAELQARQDLKQKCEYIAEDIADELPLSMKKIVNDVIGALEKSFREKLEERKVAVDSHSRDLERLRNIREQYHLLGMRLGGITLK